MQTFDIVRAQAIAAPPDALLHRIKMEYMEMPGLALTDHQARRLWNLDSDVCDAVLAALVTEQFLALSRDGSYRRPGRF